MTRIPRVWPVWWETGDGRPAGNHFARVLDAKPYDGKYKEFFSHVLKLEAPESERGWLEMSVDLRPPTGKVDMQQEL